MSVMGARDSGWSTSCRFLRGRGSKYTGMKPCSLSEMVALLLSTLSLSSPMLCKQAHATHHQCRPVRLWHKGAHELEGCSSAQSQHCWSLHVSQLSLQVVALSIHQVAIQGATASTWQDVHQAASAACRQVTPERMDEITCSH